MSQFPPPPPPPAGGYPPGNFPPPGYQPPGAYPQGYPTPSTTSISSVISLIFGILGCIPLVTGLIAVIAGIIGIGATSKPNVKGRGMAFTGIVLGVISLLCWGSIGIIGFSMWSASKPQRIVANQFVTDLSRYNLSAAAGECTANITADQVQICADEIKAEGPVQQTIGIGFGNLVGAVHYDHAVAEIIQFTNGKQLRYELGMIQDSNGAWKIDAIQNMSPHYAPPITNQPATGP